MGTPGRCRPIRLGALGTRDLLVAAIGAVGLLGAGAAPAERATGEGTSLPPIVYRVADVRTEPAAAYPPAPWLNEFVELDGALLFRGWDGVHGWELWRTDATAEGTWLVADICPGKCSSQPWELRPALGAVYFSALDPDHGVELWRTDGTASGTELVADLFPGAGNGRPGTLVEFQGLLFFSADDGVSGRELWRSDGTGAGTAMVADIQPGSSGSFPSSLYAVGSRLHFAADDGAHGNELWITDGTQAGTALVEDLCEGPGDGLWQEEPVPRGPRIFRSVGDRLIASSSDVACTPWRIWVSDGTPEGTEPLLDLEPAGLFPFPAPDGAVLLGARDESYAATLWRSDGTPEGTWEVAAAEYPRAVGTLGGDVYFEAWDVEHGRELWRTDGTAAGTMLVKNIQEGPGSALNGYLALGVSDGSKLLFYADDGATGIEPWVTDGTSQGTLPLGDLNPGPANSVEPLGTVDLGASFAGTFLFLAFEPEHGFEPWRSDGTPQGTELLADLDAQASALAPWPPGPYEYAERLAEIAASAGGLVFAADDGVHGMEPWVSDGTAPGTHLLADLCPDCDESVNPPRSFVSLDDRAYFLADDGMGAYGALWVTDGTEAGTELLDPLPSGFRIVPWRGQPGRVLVEGGPELWVSDGSPEGTTALVGGYVFETTTPAGAHAFFTLGQDSGEGELWRTDGTPAGTELVADLNPEGASYPWALAALGPRVVFGAEEPVTGREPWVSDGTLEGTLQLADLNPGAGSSMRADALSESMRLGEFVYFVADDGLLGEELWRTDGAAAPEFVGDLTPGAPGSAPRLLAASGDRLFFSALDRAHGRELWVVDSAAPGPALVRDINPGPASGIVDARNFYYQLWREDEPIVWRGRLYFAATDGAGGLELWSSDGTAEGTSLERDIHPGPGSSSPSGFALFEDRLYFAATDGQTGFELWALDPVELVFADGFESGDVSAWSAVVP